MTKEDEAAKCKLRFKGVENFLRRVAFNLGNTPSQTEVKIISCIPIDVTDLQQKIIQLEKQLEGSRIAKNPTKDEEEKNDREASADDSQKPTNGTQKPPNGSLKRASTVQTALCTHTFPRFSKLDVRAEKIDCCLSNNMALLDDSSSKRRKSATSSIFSTMPSIKATNLSLQTKQSKFINDGNYCAVTKNIRPNFFKKNKRLQKKNVNSHLVYYTEADGNPFRYHEVTHTTKEMTQDESELITRSYLSNMIRKQYRSMQVLDELSNTSDFTSPVCKDVEQDFQRLYETDMCSCCHGPFQNIDNFLPKTSLNTYSTLALNENNKRNTYYDSNMYDLIPVKEKPVKNRKEFEIPKRKEPKIDINCWAEEVRIKPKYQPYVVNHHTIISDKNKDKGKALAKINSKRARQNNNTVNVKPTRYINKVDQQTGMESSKSCLVDFGELYPKTLSKLKTVKLSHKAKALDRNVDCLTTDLNHSACQTSTFNPITRATENKTEATLNQIKFILQSVLTEVKTNSQLKAIEEKTKKDAIVQKEASQNNMEDRSSLLNSFTYSPYNINPYGPSCSKQIPSNCFCYSAIQHPIKCIQNYPLIIQGTRRHLCTGCFQSSQFKAHTKTAITAATNTDDFREHRSKETKKLIQEIYKSVALSVPVKETSLSEYSDLKSIKATKVSSNPSKYDREVRLAISEVFKNRNVQIETSTTQDTSTIINSKIPKTDSTRSRITSTDSGSDNQEIQVHKKTKTFETNKNVEQTTETDPETNKEVKPNRSKPKRNTAAPSTISESSESEDSSDTESDETVVSAKEIQVKKKSGLLCRMFQMFSKTTKNNIKEETEPEEPDTSDSDDYQTVCSHKSRIPKDAKRITRKSRAHSKILHSRPVYHTQWNPERARRAPYMEQEYRRYWNEKLMFLNQKQKYSSEKPFSNETTPSMRNQRPYYENYEGRSVLVDPRRIYSPQLNHHKGNSLNRNAPADVDWRNRLGHQTNYDPGDDRNFRTQERTRPSIPISTFNRGIYQNTSPTLINGRNGEINEPKSPGGKTPVGATKLKGVSWFKKPKLGIRCGGQWKQLILES